MNLKTIIQNYNPTIEQEIKDKEVFLKYIDLFKDVTTRKNELVHFISSAFVTNKDKTKILMIHHNIYKAWGWTGGHADGDEDLLAVAIKEAKEETGIKNIKILTSDIASIDTLPMLGHFKKGVYVTAHIHLSVAYILEADENEVIRVKEDENSAVEWIDIDKVTEVCTEEHMKPIYTKLINKIMEYK